MAQQVILTTPQDPRVGVFMIDAPDEDTARKLVFEGKGDIVWSTNNPQFNESLIKKFGPVTSERVRSHIGKLAGEFSESGSVMLRENLPTRLARGALDISKKSALPVGGAALGGAVSPLFGVPSTLGSSFGGAAGELTNQILGITPFDMQQIMLAGAVGGAGRGASYALPNIGPRVNVAPLAKRLPGASGAMTELATQQLRTVPTSIEFGTVNILGNETIDSLFDLALQTHRNLSVPAGNLRSMIARGLLTEKNAARFGLQFGDIRRILSKTAEQTQKGGKALTLGDLDLLRRRIGARIGRMGVDSEQRNVLRSMYKGIMDDLEKAAAQEPGAAALLTGIKVSRREFAARDFGDFLEQRILGNPRADGLQPIAIGRLKKEIDNMLAGRPSRTFELFEGSLSRQELTEIKDLVDYWAENLLPLPPPKGVQHGSGPTAAAGAVGYLFGGGQGAAAMMVAKDMLTKAMMSRSGRAAMVNLISRRQPINLTELVVLTVGDVVRQKQLQPNLTERFSAPKLEAPIR